MKKVLIGLGILIAASGYLWATTTNMGLDLPVVGSTTGPGWATQINNAFTTVDAHDHSSGKGVQISNAGISAAAAIARSKLATGGGSFVLINDNSGVMSQELPLQAPHGGTGFASYATGDLLYACSATGLCPIHIGSANQVLKTVGGAPIWATVSPGSGPTVSIVTGTSHSGGFSANGSGTYTLPTSPTPVYIEVEMVGPGGGGGGATANDGSAGSAATTFGTSLLSAGLGSGGANGGGGGGGAPGTASITGNSFAGLTITGSAGQGGANSAGGAVSPSGGQGGATALGGNGSGGAGATAGGNAAANSGSGGGGGGGNSTTTSGGGGGSGAYIKAKSVTALSASYPYVVGSGGSGAAAGTRAGGNGAGGIIIVTEFY